MSAVSADYISRQADLFRAQEKEINVQTFDLSQFPDRKYWGISDSPSSEIARVLKSGARLYASLALLEYLTKGVKINGNVYTKDELHSRFQKAGFLWTFIEGKVGFIAYFITEKVKRYD